MYRSKSGPHALNNSALPLTGYWTYRIHLINSCISFHSCHFLSPSETCCIVSAHRLPNIITLLTLKATRSEYHTQLAKMSFDKIFDFKAGVYFNFFNILVYTSIYISNII